MAFDFNGKKSGPSAPGSPFSGQSADSGKFTGGSPFGSVSSDQSPFKKDPGARGFSDMPKKKGTTNWNTGNWENGSISAPAKRKKRFRPTGTVSAPTIPVRLLLVLVLAVVIILSCVIFQEEITNFLGMVLAWVLTIALVVIILKILFHRPRRR